MLEHFNYHNKKNILETEFFISFKTKMKEMKVITYNQIGDKIALSINQKTISFTCICKTVYYYCKMFTLSVRSITNGLKNLSLGSVCLRW